MKNRELIIELLKYDLDLPVYLVNGNDLMAPSSFQEVKTKLDFLGTPPKLDAVRFEGSMGFYPNALLIQWT